MATGIPIEQENGGSCVTVLKGPWRCEVCIARRNWGSLRKARSEVTKRERPAAYFKIPPVRAVPRVPNDGFEACISTLLARRNGRSMSQQRVLEDPTVVDVVGHV